jgi:peptidoglycan/LPS O-acetylase OafA/YrhL
MKRTVILFVIVALVLITCVFWFLNMETGFNLMNMLQFGIIILIVGFAIFIGIKKLSSAKRGEPTEDELSKKVLQKTASLSYYISLYLWLIVMYLSDKVKMSNDQLIGAGILGMALTFAICWVIFNLRGVRNE